MKIRTLAVLSLGWLLALPVAAEDESRREREEQREGRVPEPMYENFLRQFEWGAVRSAPFQSVAPGAYAGAVKEGQDLRARPPKVNGVAGTWKPVGVGPLIANAGRTVLLRFGYTSDPGTNLAGFYVDDVRVTDALGTKLLGDDLESSRAWQSSGSPGFVYVTASGN